MNSEAAHYARAYWRLRAYLQDRGLHWPEYGAPFFIGNREFSLPTIRYLSGNAFKARRGDNWTCPS